MKRLITLLTRALSLQKPVSDVAGFGVDLLGDVLIAPNNDATAAKIRKGLREHILEIFEQGNPMYLVAHSLGTVYALDVINELMKEDEIFRRESRKTWPVQALVTMGSFYGRPRQGYHIAALITT